MLFKTKLFDGMKIKLFSMIKKNLEHLKKLKKGNKDDELNLNCLLIINFG